MSERPTLGTSMTEWAVKLQEHGLVDIAKQIDDDKITSLAKLDELGLPHVQTEIIGVLDFQADPARAFELIDLAKYMVILASKPDKAKAQQRFRAVGLAKEEIEDFVRTTLKEEDYANYDLLLQDLFPQFYGGNIVCSTNGNVFAEIVEGPIGHNDLVTSRKNPEFTVRRDLHTGRFLYSFEDEDLRRGIWRTLTAIPHEVEQEEFGARRMEFRPGYYEFYLTRETEDGGLRPIFMDYSDQPAFIPE
jgi:hypothetical protein